MSFEIAEDTAFAGTPPARFGHHLAPEQVPHLHASTEWPVLFRSIAAPRNMVITLHDCSLITGGCPYPLDCPHFELDCAEPCPRNYAASHENRLAKKRELDRLRPIFVSPSRWLARLVRATLPDHTVRVIPNGIPWPDAPPDKLRARGKLGIHPNARTVLFAAHGGFRAAYKSGDHWMEIWRELRRLQPGIVGYAVGGDNAGEEEGLILWPYVDREKLALLMAASDCLAYPTLADNHSMLVLEAMASALPVVAPDVGGISEQITDDFTGIMADSEPRAFARAVSQLIENPARIREIGQTAFIQGGKRFTDDRMARQYLPLYQQSVSGLQTEKKQESDS